MKKLTFLILILNLGCISTLAQTYVDSLINRSYEFRRAGKVDKAVAEISKAIALQPRNAELYLKRADLMRAERKFEDALERDILKAIELMPNDFQTRLTGARFLSEARKLSQALDVINTAILQNPVSAEAFAQRAQIYTRLEKFDDALKDWDATISLEPLNDIYKHNRANALRLMNKTDNSVESFSNLIDSLELKLQNGDTGDRNTVFALVAAYINRSRIYIKDNEMEKAFADLDRAVEIDPNFTSHHSRGRAYLRLERYDKVIEDYSQAIKKKPSFLVLYLERGDVYALMGKYVEASADYEKLAAEDSKIREVALERIKSLKAKIESKKQ